MTEEHLNNALLLHIHRKETDTLDITQTAHSFVSANEKRMDIFGIFV